MSVKQFAGSIVVMIGIGCLGVWVDRQFLHPTAADREFVNRIAENGGIQALHGRGPAFVFLLLGIGALRVSQKLFDMSK